jgi:hypothetical protein
MPIELFLPISALLALLVFLQYHRSRRLIGGLGWVLVLLAVGGFGSGLAESFAWSGLVFLFLGGTGLVAILQDVAFVRQSRRQRNTPRSLDPDGGR